MYERIVIALDGSVLAERVIPYVEPLSEKFGSTVILLRATASPEELIAPTAGEVPSALPAFDPTPILESERRDADTYLRGIAERFQVKGINVRFERPEGPAATTIVEHARAHGADLIAMTTHGRSGLGRLVFGSVAEDVLRHAPCPVLLVRVAELPSDER